MFNSHYFVNPSSNVCGSSKLIANNQSWAEYNNRKLPIGKVTKYITRARTLDQAIDQLLKASGPDAKMYIYDVFHITNSIFCFYSTSGLPYELFLPKKQRLEIMHAKSEQPTSSDDPNDDVFGDYYSHYDRFTPMLKRVKSQCIKRRHRKYTPQIRSLSPSTYQGNSSLTPIPELNTPPTTPCSFIEQKDTN